MLFSLDAPTNGACGATIYCVMRQISDNMRQMALSDRIGVILSVSLPQLPKILSIRASVLQPILGHFAENEGIMRKLLRANGLPTVPPSDPYAPIPLRAYLALFEDAAEAAEDPVLGARLGFACRPGDLAPIGLLAIQAGTIRGGISAMARFGPALQTGTTVALEDNGETLVLSYRIAAPGIAPTRQDAEFTLAALCGLVRTAFDLRWRPEEIHFHHRAHDRQPLLERWFGCPVIFGQPANRILMSATEADRQHRTEDRDLIALIERHLTDMSMTDAARSLSEQVEALISRRLGLQPIDLLSVASALEMSPRTVQRQLANEGTSLSVLVQKCRLQMAEKMLLAKTQPIEAIAASLGYADGTAFWRAYRGWTGHAPTQARRASPADAHRLS